MEPEALAAAISVAAKRFADSRAQAARMAQLEADLATRKLLDRAKGKLMQDGLSEDEAYQMIQDLARRGRQTLAAAAAAVLTDSQGTTGGAK